MGFEVIHQPKSNAVFFSREIPWLILLLSQPSLTLPALNSVFVRG